VLKRSTYKQEACWASLQLQRWPTVLLHKTGSLLITTCNISSGHTLLLHKTGRLLCVMNIQIFSYISRRSLRSVTHLSAIQPSSDRGDLWRQIVRQVFGKRVGIKCIVLVTGVRGESYFLMHRESELIRCKREPPVGPGPPHSRGF